MCYVCATVKNSPIFMKTRKYLNMKKAPKTLGFKGFSEILINFFIISLRTEVRDEQPSDRTHLTLIQKDQYSCGFTGFPLSVNP